MDGEQDEEGGEGVRVYLLLVEDDGGCEGLVPLLPVLRHISFQQNSCQVSRCQGKMAICNVSVLTQCL